MKKRIISVIIVLSMLLVGCKTTNPYDISKDILLIGDEHLTKGIVNILFYSFEKKLNNANSSIYGESYLDSICFKNPDISFAEYEKEYIFYENMVNMFCLSNKWRSNNSLSEEDTAFIEKESADCFDLIGDETKTFLSLELSDLKSIFTAKLCADRMKEELSKQTDSQISEEEIRVVSAIRLDFSNEEKAKEAASKLDEGKDVYSLKSICEGFEPVSLSREECSMNTAALIFSLRKGEHTGIINENDSFSIYYLLEAYQKELSEARKKELLDKRFKTLLKETCETYRNQISIYINEEQWKAYSFKNEELPAELDIFEKYLNNI